MSPVHGSGALAPIDFWFDFISPYGYFAAEQVQALAARHGRGVRWRCFHMVAVMKEHLGQAEALVSLPLKGPYIRHDVRRSARLHGLPYAPAAGPFSSVAAARCFCWLQARQPDMAVPFALAVFRGHHAQGLALSAPAACLALAATVGADTRALGEALQGDAPREAFKLATAQAVQAGVWGTPTFGVDGELFWGADRLPQVERWLATGGW